VKAGRKLRKDPLTRKWAQATFALLYLVHICWKFSKIRIRGRNFEDSESCLLGLRFPNAA
jgi:ABC-type phosphate/phosphonate transport system permease subunit